jgi:hypothetical protein
METSTEAGDRRKTLILVGVLVALFVLALLLVRRATLDVGADQTAGASGASAGAVGAPPPFDAGPLMLDAVPEAALGVAVGVAPPSPPPPFDSGVAALAPDAASDAAKCIPESKKELCGDGVDNNCNGQIDEGCERR